MDQPIFFHFTPHLLLVAAVTVSCGSILTDSSILPDFRRIVFGKTICCVTPVDVFYGSSLLECTRQCLSLQACTAMSYQRRSLQCKLFDIDSVDSSFEEDDPSYVMAFTNQWSEELISPCSRKLCSGSTRCAIRSNGTTYCAPSEKLVNQWSLIYETNDTGGVVSGREDILISAFQSASVLRVYVPSWNQTFNLDMTIVKADEDVACSQSLFQMAKKGWNTFSEKATRVLYMFCTSGFYHMTQNHLGGSSQPSNPEEFGVIGMRWFTRYCQHLENYPIYRNNKNGRHISGSFHKLQSAILQGFEVRIFSGKLIASHVLAQIVIKNGVIGAQFLRQVGSIQKIASDNTVYRMFANSIPSWTYSIYSSDGTLNKIRLNIGTGKKMHDNKYKDIDWFTDINWSAVYMHNQNGGPLDGSENKLRASVLSGKRVRLIFGGNVAGEPDSVFIGTEEHVTVQLLNQVSVSNQSYFQTNAYWFWQMISSTGFQNILRIYLGSYDVMNTEDRKTSVRWYVDTRPWRKLLVISTSGVVITGSKYQLRKSLESGGMLRLVVTFPNRTVMAFSPDNIEYYEEEVSAQFIRYIGHVQKSGSTERVFPTAPYWNFIMVTTKGTLISSLCDARTNEQVYNNPISVTTAWFVN